MCILLWLYLTYPLKENVIWKEKKFKRKDKERKEKSWGDYGLELIPLDTKGVGVLGLRLALGSGLC